MPVPGVPRNVEEGKIVILDAIAATFPAELHPQKEWQVGYHLCSFPLAGAGVDVLYRPNSPGPVTRIRRPVTVYVRDFPSVELIVCDEEFRAQATGLIAHLRDIGVSAREIQEVPYWCNWGSGREKPSPFLD